MELFGNDVGSWAEWAAAVASVISVVIAIVALKSAQAANRTAEKSVRDADRAAKEAQQREDERDQREKQRDRRRVAGNLQAWWAADMRSDKPVWGVVLSNDGAATSVFRDVTITTTANGHDSTVEVRVVPPGRFFIGQQAPDKWSLPRSAPSSEHLDPIMKSAKHTVDQILFTDPLGDCWQWTAAEGLTVRDPSG